MAILPAGAPKKPANQGGNAAAYVYPTMEGVPSVSNTSNMPHQFESTANAVLNHENLPETRGFGGSGNGAS